ncbi:putative dimeric dihydrodiol dehydrogenase protein [Phaeoacremonium minimum UCRPA7]|uniref:D-xylose 1-dehydrogenase (NADP(+), D-xylono-1,5-lactone-forming) n=1 Tax=Phaeoacremonium minimum (strain UCR-PA7) TaxID=1286976 RepID=R8BPT6_PHAM7|nr:putative dimeric dihydrodiol dehydrogenase protein [Phaeoacremonium minimum UCRPA7]EOO01320.1 putative dimeric dihydrodiol dehydrogenase protein [Phaeoacremonium minimum UCRPA7]
MFTQDILAARPDAPAKHTVVALGSSSLEKGSAFVDKVWEKTPKQPRPQVYADYQGVYDDPNVDVVYVGTPHSLHKKNCLDAIAAGKHVLCEKPFTINEKEAREVVDAARHKGVFVMEAVWTRFFPLFKALHEEIIVKKSIGEVQRFFIDFGNKMPLDTLPSNSRLKDPALGAGALLDIGVYTLTYASIILGDWKVGKQHPGPIKVTSSLDIVNGIDEANVVVLDYQSTNEASKKTAICTSTFRLRGAEDFARIEGSKGSIIIFGLGVSVPGGFRCIKGLRPGFGEIDERSEKVFTVEKPEGTVGFFWEADAVAEDIAHGRNENAIIPLDETLRMMRLMDGIRREAGLIYPQDRD